MTRTVETASEFVRVEIDSSIATIRIDRPKMNPLSIEVQDALGEAAGIVSADDEVAAVVLWGGEKVFAAGADIKEMASKEFSEMHAADWFAGWDGLTRARTPIVACVTGYALGGGCELAMMADVLVAGEGAKFGQPEINLGVIPGMGGSQRLTRAVGKAKAMDMILTGRMIGAEEAERIGLVSRVVPDERALEEAQEVAATIASKSKPAALMAKETVAAAFETTLAQGIAFERRVFHSTFATADQKEGMDAFANKREAGWQHR